MSFDSESAKVERQTWKRELKRVEEDLAQELSPVRRRPEYDLIVLPISEQAPWREAMLDELVGYLCAHALDVTDINVVLTGIDILKIVKRHQVQCLSEGMDSEEEAKEHGRLEG